MRDTSETVQAVGELRNMAESYRKRGFLEKAKEILALAQRIEAKLARSDDNVLEMSDYRNKDDNQRSAES